MKRFKYNELKFCINGFSKLFASFSRGIVWYCSDNSPEVSVTFLQLILASITLVYMMN